MKKIAITGLIAGLVMISTASFAGFGLPKVSTGNSTVNNVTNKAVDTAKNKGFEKVINDKIAKYNCQFKDGKTVDGVTCDLNKVIRELEGWRNGLEGTVANDVDINVQASALKSDLAWQRGNHVRDQIRNSINYWDYYVTSNTSSDKGLKIWVSVH